MCGGQRRCWAIGIISKRSREHDKCHPPNAAPVREELCLGRTSFRHHPVKPDRGVTRTDLADRLPFGVSMHASSIKAEGTDEEIVSRASGGQWVSLSPGMPKC